MKALRQAGLRLILNAVFPTKQFSVRGLRLFERHLVVYIDQHTSRKIALRQFEKEETAFLKRYIKPTDVCLDIGANCGYYALLFASRGGTVIAVEPVIQNVRLLQLTAVLNADVDIRVIHAAAADRPGTVEMLIPVESSLSSIAAGRQAEEAGRRVRREEVLAMTVDSLNLDKLDLVKMDVEGAEALVLKGMKDSLTRLQPRLVMAELVDEHLSRFGSSIAEVMSEMWLLGYAPYELGRRTLSRYAGGRPTNDNFFFLRKDASERPSSP